MSRATSPSVGRCYGLARVARVWKVPRSTVYAGRNEPGPRSRPGPPGPCSDESLAESIRQVLLDSPFHGEGYRKAWARLRLRGIRTSKRRVLRVMREQGLTTKRVIKPAARKRHDGVITTERPDEMWGTDMTATVTVGEGSACVFVAVDHCTTECVGIHASKEGNRFQALEPIRQGVRERFGAFAANVAPDLSLRHDHGSNYLSDAFQKEIAWLGVTSSPAFVREPEGNGCAERFIRTLKENLLWVRTFETIEELRLALHEFKRLYNEKWLVEKHGYRTPCQARSNLLACQESAA